MKTKAVLLLVLYYLIAGTFFVLNRTDYAIDDAWITYRYAEHLASGLGFTYNAGERVLGTSTPLYTLLLAFVHLLGGNVPVASQMIGLMAGLGTVTGVFLLGKKLDSPDTGYIAAGLLVFMPYFHKFTAFGMETPLYLCCIAFTFLCFAAGRLYLSAVLASLCLLIRLDGLAVGSALFLAYLLMERKMPWKHLAVYLAIAAPWFVFSQLYFGDVIPNSFLAKRIHASQQSRTWILEWMLSQWYTFPAFLGAAFCWKNGKARTTTLALYCWAFAYAIVFSFSNLYGYPWYRSPLCIPLACFAAIAVRQISTGLFSTVIARAVALGSLTVLLILPDLYETGDQISLRKYGVIPIEKTRYTAVHWIRNHVPEEAVIASGGIGHLGYFTHNYILDTVGLIAPEVVKKRPPSADDFLQFTVEQYHPDYVFQALKEMPAFMASTYTIVKVWPTGDPLFPRFMLIRRTQSAMQEFPASIDTASQ